MGLREQSIVGCFREFVFVFSVVHIVVGLRKQIIKKMFFPTWACDAGFNNNNNNNNKYNNNNNNNKNNNNNMKRTH